jgi:hypothetical protein
MGVASMFPLMIEEIHAMTAQSSIVGICAMACPTVT